MNKIIFQCSKEDLPKIILALNSQGWIIHEIY